MSDQFAFDTKRDAIGPHVLARWGWDEQFQLELCSRSKLGLGTKPNNPIV
jgi:hypothetical protein